MKYGLRESSEEGKISTFEGGNLIGTQDQVSRGTNPAKV